MHNQSKKCQFIGGKYIGGDGYLEKIDQLISSSGDKSREIAVTGSAGMSRLRSTIRAVHLAGFPLGEFVRANKQKTNVIGW